MADNNLRYQRRNSIDKVKWDRCIDEATNGEIYAYSWYLDTMASDWDALIFGDYEAVMPLPKRSKYGIKYVYQPAFTAALGVFGKNVSQQLVKKFINVVSEKFRLVEVSMNEGNLLDEQPGSIILCNNFVLDLSPEYSILFDNYRENIRRNVQKAQQYGCYFKKDIPVDEVIRLSEMNMRSVTNIKPDDYIQLRKLFDLLYARKQAMSYGVYTSANQLVASCIFFFSNNKAYYIVVGNHPNGKTLGASHFLIDRFIHEHAGSNLLLDFEGSDIPGLAFFYSSFNAAHKTYPALRINRLPFFINALKKLK
jgi:hypothetical protein